MNSHTHSATSRTGRAGRCLLLAGLALLLPAAGRSADAPPKPPQLLLVGSDSLRPLLSRWAEDFLQSNRHVSVEITMEGSATAPRVIAADADYIAVMTRPMTADEQALFTGKRDRELRQVVVAQGPLVVFVHHDNPLTNAPALAAGRLAPIFAETESWRDASPPWSLLTDAPAWTNRQIHLYGRNASAGVRDIFRAQVLAGREFNARLTEQPGEAEVVLAVANDPDGLGYGSVLARSHAAVAAIPIVAEAAGPPAGTNPVLHDVVLGFHHATGKPVPPVHAAFLRLVLGPRGQAMAAEAGLIALPPQTAADRLKAILP